MRTLIGTLALGYGGSGAAALVVAYLCACVVAALAVFWLGGAAAALGCAVLLCRPGASRDRAGRYSLQ